MKSERGSRWKRIICSRVIYEDIGGLAVRGTILGRGGGSYHSPSPSACISTPEIDTPSLTTAPLTCSASSTQTPTPPLTSSALISSARPSSRGLIPRFNWSFSRAARRSEANGEALGGSSVICSQPIGGEPGGEMRKFFSSGGGARWLYVGSFRRASGVWRARKTRSVQNALYHRSDWN